MPPPPNQMKKGNHKELQRLMALKDQQILYERPSMQIEQKHQFVFNSLKGSDNIDPHYLKLKSGMGEYKDLWDEPLIEGGPRELKRFFLVQEEIITEQQITEAVMMNKLNSLPSLDKNKLAAKGYYDLGNKTLTNVKKAVSFISKFMNPDGSWPSGKNVEDLILFVREKMFLENNPEGTFKKECDFFDGYMAFVLFSGILEGGFHKEPIDILKEKGTQNPSSNDGRAHSRKKIKTEKDMDKASRLFPNARGLTVTQSLTHGSHVEQYGDRLQDQQETYLKNLSAIVQEKYNVWMQIGDKILKLECPLYKEYKKASDEFVQKNEKFQHIDFKREAARRNAIDLTQDNPKPSTVTTASNNNSSAVSDLTRQSVDLTRQSVHSSISHNDSVSDSDEDED